MKTKSTVVSVPTNATNYPSNKRKAKTNKSCFAASLSLIDINKNCRLTVESPFAFQSKPTTAKSRFAMADIFIYDKDNKMKTKLKSEKKWTVKQLLEHIGGGILEDSDDCLMAHDDVIVVGNYYWKSSTTTPNGKSRFVSCCMLCLFSSNTHVPFLIP